MAIAKKKEDVALFRVPSLTESSPEYAALIAKQVELQGNYSTLNAERTKLRREVEAEKASGAIRVSPDVARLLGDPADSVTALSQRLREVTAEMGHVEAAQEILRRRTEEARAAASRIVCGSVRPEYQRRLSAVCAAAQTLESARQQHDELLDALDAEDVSKSFLRPVIPHFLGDRRDGKIGYFLREVVEAGHHV